MSLWWTQGLVNGNGNMIYKFTAQAVRTPFASGQTLGETLPISLHNRQCVANDAPNPMIGLANQPPRFNAWRPFVLSHAPGIFGICEASSAGAVDT